MCYFSKCMLSDLILGFQPLKMQVVHISDEVNSLRRKELKSILNSSYLM